MSRGFYSGSFDPFTNGHLRVIKQASKIFDEIIIGVGVNPNKTRKYPQEDIAKIIRKILKKENINAKVIIFTGKSVEAAIANKCNFLIRGIRNNMDYEYEEKIASSNEKNFNVDTVYIRAGQFEDISSTKVRELLKNNEDVSKYVPDEIYFYLKEMKK